MPYVCPQCHSLFEESVYCPRCGARRSSWLVAPAPVLSEPTEPWQHTAVGRLLIGLVLAQGIAYALYLLAPPLLLLAGRDLEALWTRPSGLILSQVFQGIGLLLGGALAGAGQTRGGALGGMLGVVNGFVALLLQQLRGEPILPVLLYTQPLIHLFCGALGGLAGAAIWKPLPPLPNMTPTPASTLPAPRAAWFPPRLLWGRLLLGTAVTLSGLFWPRVILNFVLDLSQGKMTLATQRQADMVTWEISGLLILLGAALSGVSSSRGLSQGFAVALLSSLFFVSIRLGLGTSPPPEQLLLTLLALFVLAPLGGWFGSRLFPPLLPRSRQRMNRFEI